MTMNNLHRYALLACAVSCAVVSCRKDEAAPEASKAAPALKSVDVRRLPQELVYAASSEVRIVDANAGRVVGQIPLKHAVFGVEFSPDGRSAFLASSAGVYEVDVATHETTQLTAAPASAIVVDAPGAKLFVLQHEVIVHQNGTRDVEPFHLVVLDLATRRVIADEEVGPRVVFATPTSSERHHVVVTSEGQIRLGKPGLGYAEASAIDLKRFGVDGEKTRIGRSVAMKGARVYVPIEGALAQVIVIDLVTGNAQAINFERMLRIRGLAVTQDERTLFVNSGTELIAADLSTRKVRAAVELPATQTGLALSSDGQWAFLAQTIDGTGGAVTIAQLDPLSVFGKVHLDDISPWAIGVRAREAKR